MVVPVLITSCHVSLSRRSVRSTPRPRRPPAPPAWPRRPTARDGIGPGGTVREAARASRAACWIVARHRSTPEKRADAGGEQPDHQDDPDDHTSRSLPTKILLSRCLPAGCQGHAERRPPAGARMLGCVPMTGESVECFNCGRANPSWAQVCRSCGVPMRPGGAGSQPPSGRVPTDRDSLVSIGAALATIGLAIVFGLILSGMLPEAPAVIASTSPTPSIVSERRALSVSASQHRAHAGAHPRPDRHHRVRLRPQSVDRGGDRRQRHLRERRDVLPLDRAAGALRREQVPGGGAEDPSQR